MLRPIHVAFFSCLIHARLPTIDFIVLAIEWSICLVTLDQREMLKDNLSPLHVLVKEVGRLVLIILTVKV